jgi:cell wall-associated NlpC family hydrolase
MAVPTACFQQHPEYGWGTVEQVTDPAYAARAFYSRLIQVPGWDTLPLTVAAQAVQRSAFPDRYAAHEKDAIGIVATLAGQACMPPTFHGSGGARGMIAVREAVRWMGTPYSWGGGGTNGPSRGICCSPSGADGRRTVGFDCSGLTQRAWAAAGVGIGSTTGPQWRSGRKVAFADLQPGDLVFFGRDSDGEPTHVGLYLGDGMMVHAPSSGDVVHQSPLAPRLSDYRGAVRPAG